MGRRRTGAFTTVASVGAVVVGLAVLDERVRDQIAALASGRRPSGELAGAGRHLQDLALTAFDALGDQSVSHTSLAVFAVGALVLLVLMIRS
jgi:hypothetical protein